MAYLLLTFLPLPRLVLSERPHLCVAGNGGELHLCAPSLLTPGRGPSVGWMAHLFVEPFFPLDLVLPRPLSLQLLSPCVFCSARRLLPGGLWGSFVGGMGGERERCG